MGPSDARAAVEEVVGRGGALAVSRREARWLALGPEVVAFVADDEAGWARLLAEGDLARAWRAAGIPAPSVLAEDAGRRVQARARLHGLVGEGVEARLFGADPSTVDRYDPGAPLSPFGERLAASYGELAARIRAAVLPDGAVARALGPRAPEDLDEAAGLLRRWEAAPEVTAAVDRARNWLAERDPSEAVVHGDLHFHNLCLAEDGGIVGVFDLDGAGVDEPWADLQYVHSLGPRFVARALGAYAATAGAEVDLRAVRRRHLLVALGHLRWHPPGSPRHRSVLGWVGDALRNMVPRRCSTAP